jgi:argininosuccinate lyase
MGWTGGDCGYLVLPDRLAGISSAMPQKRNHPVLERIRGRTAHLTSAYQDVALSQRNTPFSNMVEVSKESTVAAYGMFDMLGSVLRLLTEVLGSLEADPSRAAERCAAEHLGAFTLANRLTLELGVPWRDAQVAVGRYIAAHVRGAALVDSAELLADALAEIGHPTAARTDIGFRLPVEGDELLNAKVTPGSTNPAAVAAMLSEQAERAAGLRTEIRRRAEEVSVARREVDESLGVGGLDGAAR